MEMNFIFNYGSYVTISGLYDNGEIKLDNELIKPTGTYKVLVSFLGTIQAENNQIPIIEQLEKNGKYLSFPSFGLNRNEIKALKLLKEGMTNREIAKAMGVREGTAKNYVSGLLTKFKVKNRTQLVVNAIELKVI